MKIQSESDASKYYDVQLVSGHYLCNCPNFQYKAKECKHIKKIRNEGTSMNQTQGVIQAKSISGLKINEEWYNLKVPTNITNFGETFKGQRVSVDWEEAQGRRYINTLTLEPKPSELIQKRITRISSMKLAVAIATQFNVKTETELFKLANKIEEYINEAQP